MFIHSSRLGISARVISLFIPFVLTASESTSEIGNIERLICYRVLLSSSCKHKVLSLLLYISSYVFQQSIRLMVYALIRKLFSSAQCDPLDTAFRWIFSISTFRCGMLTASVYTGASQNRTDMRCSPAVLFFPYFKFRIELLKAPTCLFSLSPFAIISQIMIINNNNTKFTLISIKYLIQFMKSYLKRRNVKKSSTLALFISIHLGNVTYLSIVSRFK